MPEKLTAGQQTWALLSPRFKAWLIEQGLSEAFNRGEEPWEYLARKWFTPDVLRYNRVACLLTMSRAAHGAYKADDTYTMQQLAKGP